MKFKFGAAPLIPLAAIVVGAVFAYMGIKYYGYWHPRRGPQPGFYPALAGVALVLTGVVGVVKSLKETAPAFSLRDWYVPIGVAAVIGSSYIAGMLPSLAVFIVVWLKVVQKTGWKTVAVVLASVFAIVYGVFILWLQVPFETGIVYRTLWPAF